MSSLVPSPIYDSQDPAFLVEVVRGLPSPTAWELRDQTVKQRIIEANDYINNVEHAIRVNEHESAMKLFLKAFRIAYILLPVHPECAQMHTTDEAALPLRKLRHRIEETHMVVMKIATPEELIQSTRRIYPSPPNTPPMDTSMSPPSPTRSNPISGEASLGNHNVHLFPPRRTHTSTPPISAAIVNANVQALFDEASSLFGELRPLSQNDSPHLPNENMEDASFLVPSWTVHQRKISEPEVFAATYEDPGTTHGAQNINDMFVNKETGGGRDVQLYPEDEPPGPSNVTHDGEISSSPLTFLAEDSETSASPTKKSRMLFGKTRSSSGSIKEDLSAVKTDPLARDNSKSRRRASDKIVFASTSSNDVKIIVKSSQPKALWPRISTEFLRSLMAGSDANKVSPGQLVATEKNSKKQPSASYSPSANGIPTYIPLISFMHQPPRAHRHTSLKKKNEQSPTLKASGNTGPQLGQMVPGEQTGDHLDPNDNSMSNDAAPQVHVRPPNNQRDNHASSVNGPTPCASPNTSTPNPILARLRLHARSNLGCIKYMSFSGLISYSNDCFSNMRMYSEIKDYANAYTHGIQGMIIVTNVLPHHHECRPETGLPYFNYVAAVEVNFLRAVWWCI
ncbi:hypothetical protein K450DRAFT_237665 [Umbelopsis ramanniana AG]|uniref:Uncharacterized protein n=1 Tax=Umbelopsis ramanniana AG TaxID=1314678 RepID=A0AAD5EAS8_UMBRA|nr:uncharacterized protein K450DRAFT_237665 [Umbelopsis ramanniana AG]KAI8580268.1 hypothetical protein K450DRAFT_237665 [Umbelopsis ramanniana AG]